MKGFATLADIEAFESVPLEDRNLPRSTYDLIARSAQNYPDNMALNFFLQGTDYQNSVRINFREFFKQINQTANMFHSLGIGPTDTVSYILPNLPETYLTLYGGEAAGIANPINPLLESHTLAEIMNTAKTKVLVTLAPFPRTDIWEKVSTILSDVPTLETVLQIDIATYLSGVRKLVVNLMRLGKNKTDANVRVASFHELMRQQPGDRLLSGRQIQPDDIASYFHTGGTTGTPKLAQHTHFNEVFDAFCVSTSVGGGPDSINFLGLPLFHNYGAIAIGLGSWIHASGVVMATPSGYRGEGVMDNLWQILGHYRCSLLPSVPTVFNSLLDKSNEGIDLSALEVATCGAAPLPVELARQFEKKSGIKVLEGYGLTEGTSVNSVNPMSGDVRVGSIGLRFPYQEMRAAVIEGGKFERFCEPNETGIIILRGPNVFPGYNDPFHNEGAFVESGDEKGKWLNTGDMGYQDEDGYFWLTGRKKELIIRGGHNIDPKQIEEPMHEHPAVALAAAVGRPDARVGELPVVYVELKPGAQTSEDELLRFAQERIGERAAVPKEIKILETLPLTAVGKIYKPALAHEQVEQVLSAALKEVPYIAAATVKAEGDKRLGTIANVTVKATSGADVTAVEAAVKQALGQFTIHTNVKVNA